MKEVEEENCKKLLVGKCEETREFGQPQCRSEDVVKVDPKEMHTGLLRIGFI